MNWLILFVCAAVQVAFLLGPGFFVLKACGFRPHMSLALAPLVSLPCLFVLTTLYAVIGLRCSALTLAPPLLVLAVLTAALPLRRKGSPERPGGLHLRPRLDEEVLGSNIPVMALYVLVALAVVAVVFLRSISTPLAFSQDYDNIAHLAKTTTMVKDGVWLLFGPSYTARSLPVPIDQLLGSYYPSAWYWLAALPASVTGAPTPLAFNASIVTTISVVLPLSTFALLSVLFPKDRAVVAAGSVLSVGFCAFPWAFTWFGPIYPNLFGLSLAPAFLAVAIVALGRKRPAEGRSRWLVLLFLVFVSGFLTHASALFSVALLAMPFIAARTGDVVELTGLTGPKRSLVRLVAVVLGFAACCGIWWVVYRLPALHSLVQYNWPAKATPEEGLSQLLGLTFTQPGLGPQLVLAVLVGAGFVDALKRPGLRWLDFSLLVAGVVFVVDISSDGPLKQLLAGFWYTDPYRTAGTVVLVAIPLAALSLGGLLRAARDAAACHGAVAGRLSALTLLGLVALLNYWPYSISAFGFTASPPFWHESSTIDRCYIPKVEWAGSDLGSLSATELDFVKKATELVGDDEPIINLAPDGSALAYSAEGANMLYRYSDYAPADPGDTSPISVIRDRLVDVAVDEEVASAVRETGAHYLILLDQGNSKSETPGKFISNQYKDGSWRGIEAVTDDTPGFKVILSEGDMRLYEIEAAS